MRSPTPTSAHIPSLDGIRAMAAMIVFVSHAGLQELIPGVFGVTVFFFLSGYLITTLLRMEREATGAISLRNFYLRRVYRILPPAYVVLFIAILRALTGNAPSGMTLDGIAAQFAFLTTYYIIFGVGSHIAPDTGAMWSLAVEEHFYLVFPIVLSLMFKQWSYRRIAVALAGFCALLLLWRCVLVFTLHVPADYTYMATDTRLDSIAVGCLLGVWLNPFLDAPLANGKSAPWPWLLAAAVGVLLAAFVYRGPEFRESIRYTLQGIALFVVFFCAIRFSGWPLFRWLEWRPIRLLGLISYTFYLIHQTALVLTGRWLQHSPLLSAFAGFLLALLFSVAMYYLVERHAATIRRRLHSSS